MLTYLLTPCSRVLLEKLTVNFAASQEIPRIYGTRKFLTIPTSAHHLSLSWTNSIQSTWPPPTSWRSILILSSHLCLMLHVQNQQNFTLTIVPVASGLQILSSQKFLYLITSDRHWLFNLLIHSPEGIFLYKDVYIICTQQKSSSNKLKWQKLTAQINLALLMQDIQVIMTSKLTHTRRSHWTYPIAINNHVQSLESNSRHTYT
jgi:hypothetical protein